MPQCAVTTCRNSHRKTKGRRVRYHRFPAEDDVRSRWVAVCGRRQQDGASFNTATARVCSLHFSPGSYERDVEHELLGLPTRSRLKRGAVPDRAVPLLLPSLVGRKKQQAASRPQRGHHNQQQQVNNAKASKRGGYDVSAAPGATSGNKRRPPPQRDEVADDVIDTSQPFGTAGIDVLLALGLTPTKNRQDGDGGLNRMHVMEEECKVTSLEDRPSQPAGAASNSPVKPCQSPPPAATDSDTTPGKENTAPTEDLAADNKKNVVAVVATAPKEPSGVKEEGKSEKAVEAVHPEVKKEQENAAKEVKQTPPKPPADKPPQETPSPSKPTAETAGGKEFNNLPSSSPGDDDDEEEEEGGQSGTSTPESENKPVVGEDRNKRASSESDSDTPTVVKKMKLSKAEYEERERAVNEFVENAAGTSLEELHRSTNKLQQEIHTLDAMSRTKEQEWNNILRLKKVKEEMYLRLQRKKQVMLIMMGASTKSGDTLEWDLTSDTRYGGDFGGCEDLRTNKNKVSDSSIASLSKFITNRQREQQGFTSHYPPQNPSSTSGVSVLKGGQQLMMVPIVSSSPGNLTRSLSISSSPFPSQSTSGALRVPDVNGKDKNGAGRGQRPILPKPTMLIPATSSANNNNNGQNPVIGEGRQGPILDVRSIIADFRSRHPETVPRRGRRMRGGLSPTPNCQMPENLVSSTRVSGSGGILSMASLALGSGSQMRTSLVGSTSELGDLSFLMSSNGEGLRQDTSRPSSTDSSRSGAQQGQPASEPGPGGGGISFKDVLVQFAKMSQAEQRHENLPPTTATVKPPPYPEVTLHPVLTPQSPPHQSPSSSLLHGILTKSTTAAQHRAEANLGSKPATFSPTLARLLTAPERLPSNIITNVPSTFHGVGQVSINDLLTTSKTRNEITITPVSGHQPMKAKDSVVLLEDDEQEDSADRLVMTNRGMVRGGQRTRTRPVPRCWLTTCPSVRAVTRGRLSLWCRLREPVVLQQRLPGERLGGPFRGVFRLRIQESS